MRVAYPWFGGKGTVAEAVWKRFGDPRLYCEPFFGGGGVFLNRPDPCKLEVINDRDGFVVNFWRAVKNNPDEVREWADEGISTLELTARHNWLRSKKADFLETLEADPDYYDVRVAGYWVYGLCLWIGSGWCEIKSRKRPCIKKGGIFRRTEDMGEYIRSLSKRLKDTFILYGDWKGAVSDGVLSAGNGNVAVFLDPPYSHSIGRDNNLYRCEADITQEIQDFCLLNADRYRIALAGYDREYDLPGWEKLPWTAQGGYSNNNKKGNENKKREMLWFSPSCLGGGFAQYMSNLSNKKRKK